VLIHLFETDSVLFSFQGSTGDETLKRSP
jgi:hypothetical protein